MSNDHVIDARDLYRFYHAGDEEVLALRGVSLQVDAGEMVAVVGPSGSGKSTLLACLAGLDEPDGGRVEVTGRRVTRVGSRQAASIRAASLGILLQSGNLIGHLSVADNVRLVQRLAGRRPARDLAGPGGLLAQLGLAGQASALPETLSGGEVARAGLAVALGNDPAALLADEPTGELDRAREAQIGSLLAGLARRGLAVLVVTHSECLADQADRVIAMADGVIEAPTTDEGTPLGLTAASTGGAPL